MILCITEKPSVAKDIAAILGADARRDGFYEGAGYCVTWTFGHLCRLLEPHEYNPAWKRWALSHLPMLPPRYEITLIDQDSIRRQFGVIRDLASRADEIINCGDAGQEGELIQRWVMRHAGVNCPVRRLWISSLTDESIREGFKSLRPQDDYENLFRAGMSRAIGDWMLGMNATRLFTLRYGAPGNVLSIGRVQTPTLALIVRRHKEIAEFVPSDSWELHTTYRDTDFTATRERFATEDEGQATLRSLAPHPFTVTSISTKDGREAPPRLFDLTSLQVETNRRWGWTAEETLRLIQSLYEKKVTTYPRVDTTYLSDDVYPKVPGILRQMKPYADITAPLLEMPRLPKTKKVFDNSKVTDHHAIIPTGQSPERLEGHEKHLYHLIAMRFIAAFYPDCRFRQTQVLGRVDDEEFKASGKVITDPGWKSLYPQKDQAAEGDDRILPDFAEGESGPHAPTLAKKTSQPPKPYTEGTLLRAMETAGRTIEDDEDLREAMKENGIGRPSTRAAIIETLFRRRYIRRERKNILPTEAGIQLIDTIAVDLLKSAKLTGIWEKKLRDIERGTYGAGAFIRELSQMITGIVYDVLSDNSHARIEAGQKGGDDKPAATPKAEKKPRAKAIRSLEQVPCPECGQGHILKGRTAYGCSRYAEGCSFRASFEQYAEDMTPAQLARKLKSKKK